MTEGLTLTLLIGTPLLYSLGGMFFKPLRRYGIPLLFMVVSFLAGSFSIKVVLSILLLCGALHLGYGENSNWLKKIIYAVALTAPSLIIRFNFWAVILPVVFLGTFYLSNKPKWQYIFNWRISEASCGFILGCLWSQTL